MIFQETELHASGLEAATGSTIDFDTANGQEFSGSGDARFYLSVTASDTPTTLDVDIVASVGGVDFVVGSFTQVGAVGTASESIVIVNCPKDVKADYTIAGTSYTFSLHATR